MTGDPEAYSLIREGRERHFDPDVLDAFLEIQEEFRAIAKQFTDSASKEHPA